MSAIVGSHLQSERRDRRLLVAYGVPPEVRSRRVVIPKSGKRQLLDPGSLPQTTSASKRIKAGTRMYSTEFGKHQGNSSSNAGVGWVVEGCTRVPSFQRDSDTGRSRQNIAERVAQPETLCHHADLYIPKSAWIVVTSRDLTRCGRSTWNENGMLPASTLLGLLQRTEDSGSTCLFIALHGSLRKIHERHKQTVAERMLECATQMTARWARWVCGRVVCGKRVVCLRIRRCVSLSKVCLGAHCCFCVIT